MDRFKKSIVVHVNLDDLQNEIKKFKQEIQHFKQKH